MKQLTPIILVIPINVNVLNSYKKKIFRSFIKQNKIKPTVCSI